MSTFVARSIRCPNCATEQEREIASSVNIMRSPHVRERILDQTFQVFECTHCGRRFIYTGEFSYVDLSRRQLFGVFPPSAESDWVACEQRTTDAYRKTLGDDAPSIAQPFGEGLVIRCVFGLPALREKLILADAGLDDVLVEAAKLDLLRSADDLPLDAAHRPRLMTLDVSEVVFGLPGQVRLPVSRDAFDRYLATAAEHRDELAEDLAAGPYVDLGRVLVG